MKCQTAEAAECFSEYATILFLFCVPPATHDGACMRYMLKNCQPGRSKTKISVWKSNHAGEDFVPQL